MAVVVVDCAVVIAWALEERGPDTAAEVLERVARHGAVVPGIWAVEVANALLTAVRSKRLKAELLNRVIALIGDLKVDVDRRTNDFAWTRILSLARRHGLSAYDASYLELAARHGLALATYDRALKRAAESEGVLVLSG